MLPERNYMFCPFYVLLCQRLVIHYLAEVPPWTTKHPELLSGLAHSITERNSYFAHFRSEITMSHVSFIYIYRIRKGIFQSARVSQTKKCLLDERLLHLYFVWRWVKNCSAHKNLLRLRNLTKRTRWSVRVSSLV